MCPTCHLLERLDSARGPTRLNKILIRTKTKQKNDCVGISISLLALLNSPSEKKRKEANAAGHYSISRPERNVACACLRELTDPYRQESSWWKVIDACQKLLCRGFPPVQAVSDPPFPRFSKAAVSLQPPVTTEVNRLSLQRLTVAIGMLCTVLTPDFYSTLQLCFCKIFRTRTLSFVWTDEVGVGVVAGNLTRSMNTRQIGAVQCWRWRVSSNSIIRSSLRFTATKPRKLCK